MTYGIRTGSILRENIQAVSSQKAMNAWMSKRKRLCWSCQKDIPSNMGVSSLVGGRSDGTAASIFKNSARRWLCFECISARESKRSQTKEHNKCEP